MQEVIGDKFNILHAFSWNKGSDLHLSTFIHIDRLGELRINDCTQC